MSKTELLEHFKKLTEAPLFVEEEPEITALTIILLLTEYIDDEEITTAIDEVPL